MEGFSVVVGPLVPPIEHSIRRVDSPPLAENAAHIGLRYHSIRPRSGAHGTPAESGRGAGAPSKSAFRADERSDSISWQPLPGEAVKFDGPRRDL